MITRPSDLSVQFGRSCQSPRTGFLHLFLDRPGGDTIPIYENFCFALALIRQRTAEGVSEGKDLLERLYAFQASEGNFPVYLHDYPRCWNSLQPLRIAPLLRMLLKHFSHVIGSECKEKTAHALDRMLSFIEAHRKRKELQPMWERRYQALLGNSVAITLPQSAEEWAQELITADLLGIDSGAERLIHPNLGVYIGPGAEEAQERFKPKPTLLEWWMNMSSSQLHPLQIELGALPDPQDLSPKLWSGEIGGWQVRQTPEFSLGFSENASGEKEKNLLRWIWAGSHGLHSLSIPGFSGCQRIEESATGAIIYFDLPQEFDVSHNDLIESALYCNLSPETELFVANEKATVFGLGDSLEIRTPALTFELQFEMTAGSGEFCGQISRSNRPLQMCCKGEDLYSAFDWKISLRTLRRTPKAQLRLSLSRKVD